MEQKKGLAALLQPSKTNDPNVWDSLAGKSPSDQLNDVKKELVKLTKISTDNLKEQRRSTKSLREIEKVITKPENVALPTVASAQQQKEQVAVKGEEEQKESANNESIFSSAGLGGLGGAAAAAGALGVDTAVEGAFKLWDKTKGAVSGAASATADAAKNFYKNLKEGKAEPGLAQVLDEREKELKESREMGPPVSVAQAQQAAANQAADYKAAGETMAAAGYKTVTGRNVWSKASKEMEPADFEQAQQAQAAREAVMRGRRKQQAPIPARPDTVETPTEVTKDKAGDVSQPASKAGPNWQARLKDYGDDPTPVAHLESIYPGISKIYLDLAKKLSPRSDSQMSIKTHEEMLKLMALERIKGKDGESTVEAEKSVTPQVQAEPKPSDQVQPTKESRQKTESVEAKPSDQVQPGREAGPKSYEQLYQEELNVQKGFGTEEQQKSRASQAARLRYRSQETQVQPTKESGQKTESVEAKPSDQVQAKPSDQVQAKPSDQVQPITTQQPSQAASRISSRGAELNRGNDELKAAAAEYGITGKVQGVFEGGQLTKIRDETGKEVDVSDRLSAKQRKSVDAAREMRAANQRSGEIANQISQQSAENRDLSRQTSQPVVQPVVIQNNNNMSSQNFVPINAQPRVNSSFSKYQEKTASY